MGASSKRRQAQIDPRRFPMVYWLVGRGGVVVEDTASEIGTNMLPLPGFGGDGNYNGTAQLVQGVSNGGA